MDGTFLTRDPFPGFATVPYSQHPYQYGYSNPVSNTDPSGLCIDPITFWLCVGVVVGGAAAVGATAAWFEANDDKPGIDVRRVAEASALGGGVCLLIAAPWILADVAAVHVIKSTAPQIVNEVARTIGADGDLTNEIQPLLPTATIPIEKIRDFLFKPGATHGKDAIFRGLGYTQDDSPLLKSIFESQALPKYIANDYVLRKLDQHGQRIDIVITLPGIREGSGKVSTFISGWMIRADGIMLNTPFSGFPK